MIPETRYTKADGVHIAYQVLGQGPPDLIPLELWVSHQEAQWDVPPMAAFRERLAEFGRVITFDKPGSGMSDPVPGVNLPLLETWADSAAAVLDAVGSAQAVLIANLAGGLFAATFAAVNPDRVSRLVLVDCTARWLEAPDYPVGKALATYQSEWAEADAPTSRGPLLDYFAPSLAADDVMVRAWARYQRQAASPGALLAVLRLIHESDIRDILGAIRVPTLVIERTGPNPHLPPGAGRFLAANIANATYVPLPGSDRLIWAGDADAIFAEIQAFVTGTRAEATRNRILATVLFTDIVGSTRLAADLGDERWRAVLAEHFTVARRELLRYSGREVKSLGDGLLATFDGPGRAIRAALAIRASVAALGLEIRAGLHTGEIELQGDDIAGIAVHIAARIAALAAPGEFLVSSTVKDLVAGSGLTFIDRGTRELKGVPGEWRIFGVDQASAMS